MNKLLLTLLALTYFSIAQAQLDSILMSYIKVNNPQKVDSLLKSTSVDLHATDENGANALMWACYNADSSMVETLFEHGAKAPKEGGGIYYNGQTQLGSKVTGWYGSIQGVAAGEGKVGTLRYLLDVQKLDVDQQVAHPSVDSLSMWSPLMYASHLEQGKCMKVLILEYQANFKLQNKKNKIIEDDIIREFIEFKEESIIDRFIYLGSLNNNVSRTYYSGEYKKCSEFAKEYIQLASEIYSEKHLLVLKMTVNLAATYEKLGSYNDAIGVYSRVYKIYKDNYGSENKDCLTIQNNLAECYRYLGMYEKALPIYLNNLELTVSTLGESNYTYTVFLNNLGLLYNALGNHSEALRYNLKALEITESVLGKEHWAYATRLSSLASTYSYLGELEKSLELFERGNEVIKKTLGISHPIFASSLYNIANIHIQMDDANTAEKILFQALSILEEKYGNMHPNYSVGLVQLANIYRKSKLYQKEHETLDLVVKQRKKSLGRYHSKYLGNLYRLANSNERFFENEKRNDLLEELVLSTLHKVENELPYLPILDQMKLNTKNEIYKAKVNSLAWDKSEFSKDVAENFNLALKSRILLNSIAVNDKLIQSRIYLEWTNLKKEICKEITKPEYKKTISLDSLQRLSDRLEITLLEDNLRLGNKTKKLDVDILKSKLSNDEAIVDIVHFNFMDLDRKTDSVYYMAYIIKADKEIQAVNLFAENVLETKIREESPGIFYRGLTPRSKEISRSSLHFIWESLSPYLENVNKIYLSPSGLMNQVNFGALQLNEKSIISEKFEVKQYTSLRYMLAEYDINKNNSILLIGGVEYDNKVPVQNQPFQDNNEQYFSSDYASLLSTRSLVRDSSWNYLLGTLKEVNDLEKLSKNEKYEVQKLTAQEGSEENVKEILSKSISPRIVHFATHGFFYPDIIKDEGDNSFKSSDNPMVRSGLILANANFAWKSGEPAPGKEEDGILTALEIANLNLSNTELVVLSACDTGLGEIHGSEGVFGLQRAFKMAGARYLLMSIWEVPDAETAVFMSTFYKYWLKKNKSIPEAYAATQKKMRKKYKDPSLWAGFILVE